MWFVPVELGNAGVLAPGRWRWLRALLWLIALLVVVAGVMVAGYAAQERLVPHTPHTMPVLLPGTILGYLAYWGMVRLGERRQPGELALAALPRDLVLGLLIGAGMFTLVFTVLRLTGDYTLATGNWSDWATDLLGQLDVGLREEMWFRLIILRLMMRAFGLVPALVVSAALFGMAHLANPNASAVAAIAIAVEAGLMLAVFYLITGRIWMAVGVHAAWNLFQGSIFGARVSGITETGSVFVSGPVPGTPDWLTGGPFGPEASMPAILVGAAVFAVVFRRWRQRPIGSATVADA